MSHPTQLIANDSVVLVIDVQEKLVPAIPSAATMIRNIRFLLDAAKLLEVELAATEQYPKGLGPTVEELRDRLPSCFDKTDFSCCAIPTLTQGFRDRSRMRVVVVGMESHVCVLQTVLDLLDRGFTVYVAVDAVAGRFALDHDIAMGRMQRAGAILTTVETCVFEWTGGSRHPQFKSISALIQARMKQ